MFAFSKIVVAEEHHPEIETIRIVQLMQMLRFPVNVVCFRLVLSGSGLASLRLKTIRSLLMHRYCSMARKHHARYENNADLWNHMYIWGRLCIYWQWQK